MSFALVLVISDAVNPVGMLGTELQTAGADDDALADDTVACDDEVVGCEDELTGLDDDATITDDLEVLTEEAIDDLLEDERTSLEEPEPPLGVPQTSNS